MVKSPKTRTGSGLPGDAADRDERSLGDELHRDKPSGDAFARLGRLAVRRRWLIVGIWAAILLVAIPIAPRVVGVLRAGGFILDDLESARAKALLQTELGTPPSAVVVVLNSPTAKAGTPAFEEPAAAAIADVPSASGVVRVLSHALNP